MKVSTKITLQNHMGEKFFGEGPARLLRGIEKTGSLRSAAMDMSMAYTKALKILKNAEDSLGFPLTTRTTGGQSGGGSVLTEEGKAWLIRYEEYSAACRMANEQLFRRYYPKVGCVIMASGMSKRFGGNKLMADFNGKPLFMQALRASEGLKDHRIVVTRHKEIARICNDMGIDALLHDLPYRSDTIRLGLEALGDIDACLLMPADQPLLRRETVDSMVGLWKSDTSSIVRPYHKDQPSAPVIFPAHTFSALLSLPQGQSGRWVIKQHTDIVKAYNVEDPLELIDADTPEALAELLRHVSE